MAKAVYVTLLILFHLLILFQLILEAPDDLYCFKFCPTDPNIVCGGCINGQVVLWDITQHADRLKTQRGGNKRKNMNTLVS